VRNESPSRSQRASYWCTGRAHDDGVGRRVVMRGDMLDGAVWAHLGDLLDNPQHLLAEIERMRANDPRFAYPQ
jgi:hypothetical protein